LLLEASGDLDFASHLRSVTPPAFAMYSGDDSLTLPLLSVGGCGVVSVASHVVGPQIQQMIQAFEAGTVQEAIATHLTLFPYLRPYFWKRIPFQ